MIYSYLLELFLGDYFVSFDPLILSTQSEFIIKCTVWYNDIPILHFPPAMCPLSEADPGFSAVKMKESGPSGRWLCTLDPPMFIILNLTPR